MMLHPSIRTLLCPACGTLAPHRYLYAKNSCDILRCAQCGLGRADATHFDPAAYYTADYFSGGHADGYADYRGAEPVLRREFARTIDFIRRYRDRGRLLDVGCAYGFLLQEAKRYFDVAGIELAPEAAAYCRQNGLNVVTGMADENTLAGFGNMDVVVLLDVIEHLSEPYETLALCARYLNPGGVIVLSTGDFASPVARLMGAKWRLMTPPQHLWFFTGASMQRLARRLRLRLENIDHPWKIVPLSLVTFQLRRMFGRPAAAASRASGVGLPVNLFDAMRIVLRKAET
jgi:SAM-dependent methyltransferase